MGISELKLGWIVSAGCERVIDDRPPVGSLQRPLGASVTFANRHNRVTFAVDGFLDGNWKELVRTAGGRKQRRYVLNFDPIETDRIRFRLIRSSAPVAVTEIRIYETPGNTTEVDQIEPVTSAVSVR